MKTSDILLLGGGAFALWYFSKKRNYFEDISYPISPIELQPYPPTPTAASPALPVTQAQPEPTPTGAAQTTQQPITPVAPNVVANPNATIGGSSDVSGNQIPYAALWGASAAETIANLYSTAKAESGEEMFEKIPVAQEIAKYVRDGLLDKSVIAHMEYWTPFWIRRKLGMEGYPWEAWTNPTQQLQIDTGFTTYGDWLSAWLDGINSILA